ncbi:MAG: MFS transporter [Candidatus Odinarchaeota archaeon]
MADDWSNEKSQAIPPTKKERLAWYLYDFANTSFTVLIITALFPLYFEDLATLVFMDGGLMGGALWGYATSITMIIVAVSAPILGAVADYSGSKKKFLIFYTALCIIFNAFMFFLRDDLPQFLGIDMWMWAFILFVIANIGFQGGLPFYNAWLPEISTEETIGRIGGIGYAAGYVGAMLTIIIALISYVMLPAYPTLPFLFSALFFLIFAIPSIKGLQNRPATKLPHEEGMSYVKIGFGRIRQTFRDIRKYQGVPLFLVSYFLFADAINTVISYASIYGQNVYAFDTGSILIFFAVTQLAAIPGAFIFGYIADRIGTKITLMITLLIWVMTLSVAYLGSDPIVFWIVGMFAGVGMGSSQSTARSMYGQYIPEEKKSEMYGFYALTGKVAAILGPFVYGTVLVAAGGLGIVEAHRTAMLSILLFFVVALLILVKVRQPVKGETKIYLEDDIVPGNI